MSDRPQPFLKLPVVCREPRWNVGEITDGDAMQSYHSFRLLNRSEESIPILEVRADCGCVVSENTPREIAPGCEAGIDVSITIPTDPGNLLKHVVVRLDCDEQPTVNLEIAAHVVATPALYATSTQLHFGTIDSPDIRERAVDASQRATL